MFDFVMDLTVPDRGFFFFNKIEKEKEKENFFLSQDTSIYRRKERESKTNPKVGDSKVEFESF